MAPLITGEARLAMVVLGSVVAATGCVIAFAADVGGPLRTVLALGFLLFVPGLVLAELLPVRGPAQRFAIATGASIGMETLIGVTLIYADIYSTGLALGIVVGVTLVALVAAVVRGP